ncbi:MAG: tyrosine-type recombinase/integrase [Acidobacteriaceae bacterium]
MATYRQRRGPSGRWVWHVQIRRRGWPAQTSTFDSKSEAEAWAFEIESEMKRGRFVPRKEAEATTLLDALERYALEITPSKRGAEIEQYRLARWQRHPLALRPITSIRGKDVASYIRERQSAGAAPATINKEVNLLSHLFTISSTVWGLESLRNPVPLARGALPSLPPGRTRRLEGDEEARLLMHAYSGVAPVIRFVLATAMRRGEIASLTWNHVNLKRRSAHLTFTKNGMARSVPLSQEALAVLQSIPRQLNGSVFGMSVNAIRCAWQRTTKAAGIEGLTFHDLRHEAISRLFENTDLDAMEIARISGHRTLSMLSRYTHLRAHKLADRMDGVPRGSARPKAGK